MRNTKERYKKLSPEDRYWILYLRSGEAARFLSEVFNVRCSAKWLRALPDDGRLPFRYAKNGDRRYMLGDLQRWAENRSVEQWDAAWL